MSVLRSFMAAISVLTGLAGGAIPIVFLGYGWGVPIALFLWISVLAAHQDQLMRRSVI